MMALVDFIFLFWWTDVENPHDLWCFQGLSPLGHVKKWDIAAIFCKIILWRFWVFPPVLFMLPTQTWFNFKICNDILQWGNNILPSKLCRFLPFIFFFKKQTLICTVCQFFFFHFAPCKLHYFPETYHSRTVQ